MKKLSPLLEVPGYMFVPMAKSVLSLLSNMKVKRIIDILLHLICPGGRRILSKHILLDGWSRFSFRTGRAMKVGDS